MGPGMPRRVADVSRHDAEMSRCVDSNELTARRRRGVCHVTANICLTTSTRLMAHRARGAAGSARIVEKRSGYTQGARERAYATVRDVRVLGC
eukprot:2292219-Prymnesium_polylepis.1